MSCNTCGGEQYPTRFTNPNLTDVIPMAVEQPHFSCHTCGGEEYPTRFTSQGYTDVVEALSEPHCAEKTKYATFDTDNPHNYIQSEINLVDLLALLGIPKETADKYLDMYSKFIVPISYSCIRKGMEFKLKHKKEKVSYADCIGYALALELGIKFLTGDEKFETKDNVEFVK